MTVGLGVSQARPGGLDPKTITLGSSYTIAGQTGAAQPGAPRATGNVTLSGRWDGGRSRILLRTTTTADGRYHLTIRPAHRGKLELRLATPDHRTNRVVLTVV